MQHPWRGDGIPIPAIDKCKAISQFDGSPGNIVFELGMLAYFLCETTTDNCFRIIVLSEWYGISNEIEERLKFVSRMQQ